MHIRKKFHAEDYRIAEDIRNCRQLSRWASKSSAPNRKKAWKVLREELHDHVTLTNLWTRQLFEKVMILLRDCSIPKLLTLRLMFLFPIQSP
jgi:hypothetical protein